MRVALLALLFLTPMTCFSQATSLKDILQLKADLSKIEESIETTREKIKSVKDARFLPDLYFTLAELHVQKSRYMYSIQIAENRDTPQEELDFNNAKRPKQQAIEIYQNILDKFPQNRDRDKALFFMAHEYRELGQLEQMAQTYARLTREFPASKHWEEAQYILGNYYFEQKKDLEFALEMYSRILNRKPGPYLPLARYKMGWIYINKGENEKSLLSFEKILIDDKKIDIDSLPDIYKKTDVRRDALTSIVRPYSDLEFKELKKMGTWRLDPIRYVNLLSPNRPSYIAALKKLGKRMNFKKRHIVAVRAYYELLKLSQDLDLRMEAIESVYENMKESKKPWPVTGYVRDVATTLTRIVYSGKIKGKELSALKKNYEIYARDVATRFQRQYNKSKNLEDAKLATVAYRNYLWAFPKSKFRGIMRLNLAETQFKLKQNVRAGKNYEQLGRLFRGKKKKKSMYDSALQAFSNALKKPKELSRLSLTEARNGIRSVGRVFIKYYRRDKAIPSIRFVIGRTYYDERDFDRAVKELFVYIEKHPKGKDVNLAVDLILDAFNQREDYDGLIKAGKKIAANKRLNSSLRKNAKNIVQQAQYKKIQAKAGDFSSPGYTKNLLKFAAKYKGSDLGDQALYEAFIQLKSKKDPRAYVPGEQLLLKYGNSKYAKEVVNQMGQMALLTADFRRAAKYFEGFHQRYSQDAQAKDLLKQAATFREYMGDFEEAVKNYSQLGDKEGVARSHFLSGDWRSLVRSSSQVGGVKGSYWSGLARYRTGDIKGSMSFFQAAARSGGGSYEEKTMAAHSLYLIAMRAMEAYNSVKVQPGQEAQSVQRKDKMLKSLIAQLNKVIQFGNGRWTIAAFYTLGLVHKEFGKFIRESPNPKGLSGAQMKQYRVALAQQSGKFDKDATNYFKQCLSVGAKFEVFTQFMKGCQSKGRFVVNEAQETRVRARASDRSPPNADAIRKKLYDDSRNVNLLIQLAGAYTEIGDYSMAQLILQRASEIQTRDARPVALKGVNFMFMNELEKAKNEFKQALKIKRNDPTALWGMAGLYKEFNFTKKYRSTVSRAKRAGSPIAPLHPYIKSIR